MDFGENKKSANIRAAAATRSNSKFSFDEVPGSGDVIQTVMPSTPSRVEASQPVRIPLKANDFHVSEHGKRRLLLSFLFSSRFFLPAGRYSTWHH